MVWFSSEIPVVIELHERENCFYPEKPEGEEADHLLQIIQAAHSEQSLS